MQDAEENNSQSARVELVKYKGTLVLGKEWCDAWHHAAILNTVRTSQGLS